MRGLVVAGVALMLTAAVVAVAERELDGAVRAEGWTHFPLPRVDRETRWTLAGTPEAPAVCGRADNAASLLYRPLEGDLERTPVIRWRWKISGTVGGTSLSDRRLDDAAARLYVAFRWDPDLPGPWQDVVGSWQRLRYRLARNRYGEMPPFAALVYTWADREPVGWTAPNPRFERAIQVVVRNRDDPAGRWRSEVRDVVADFRDWFGFEPPPVSHLALLVDTDQTGAEATAWFAGMELVAAEEDDAGAAADDGGEDTPGTRAGGGIGTAAMAASGDFG